MARAKNITGLLLLALSSAVLARTASDAPPRTTAAPSKTSASSSSTTTAPALFTTAVIPMYLWKVADSLLTHYYPSTIPLNLAQASMPTQVVIGTATYDLHPASTATSALSHADKAQNIKPEPSDHTGSIDEKTLGIILGTILGAVALILIVLLLLCLRRRRRTSGSVFHRRTPSTRSSLSSSSRYSTADERGMTEEPPIPPIHPALMRHHDSYSTADTRSFMTAQERSSGPRSDHELGLLAARNSDHSSRYLSLRSSSGSRQPSQTPSMPYSPESITSTSGFTDTSLQRKPSNHPYSPNNFSHKPALTSYPSWQNASTPSSPPSTTAPPRSPHRPSPPQQQQQPSTSTNPFTSPEDEDREANDLVSPMLPSERWGRKSTVHYPSISEISDFDFAAGGEGRGGIPQQAQQQREEEAAWWNDSASAPGGQRGATGGRFEMA